MHTALWCLAAVSVLGAVVAAARPSTQLRGGRAVAAEAIAAEAAMVAA